MHSNPDHPAPSTVQIKIQDKTLIIQLPGKWPLLSWAPHNGGTTQSSCIFNHQNDNFSKNELQSIFREVILKNNLPEDSVGLITGTEIEHNQQIVLKSGPLWIHAIATVGLNNTRSVREEADISLMENFKKPCTINLVLISNALPHLSGQVEALHIATMAKTAALIENGVVSKKSGLPATGTGTDCMVIASNGEVAENYFGMHTVLGELIGKTVHAHINKGIKNWPPLQTDS